MRSGTLRYSQNAKYRANLRRRLGMRKLGAPDLRQNLNCVEIILLQPFRHFRVSALIASQLDDRNNRVGVPVDHSAVTMYPH